MARPSPARQRAMKQAAYEERRAARIEEEHRAAAVELNADAVLVRCDNCGLEQVTHGHGNPYAHPCLLCGGETATAIKFLASQEILAASGAGA